MNVQATMANKANEITGITNSVGPLGCGCNGVDLRNLTGERGT